VQLENGNDYAFQHAPTTTSIAEIINDTVDINNDKKYIYINKS